MKNPKEFKLIECSGTPYEIGLQWGEGCKESIRQASENTFNTMAFVYKASKQDVIAQAMKFLPQVQEFDPYLIDIIKGQAVGAGVSFEEILARKCTFELNFYYNNMTAMCTSFAASGQATEDGRTLLGQTIDWAPGTPIELIKVHHSQGPDQLIVSIANATEYTLSSAGFGLCANATIGQDYACSIPLGCYVPKAMRQNNVDDAMEVLKQAARGLSYYHLADARGRMIGIESVSDDFEIISPQRDYLLHSNHYLTERFKKGDVAPMFITDSFTRLERVQTLFDRHYGSLNLKSIMAILADHDNHPQSICHHVDPNSQFPSVSLAAFIMVPAEGAVYITCGNPCENEFVRYAL